MSSFFSELKRRNVFKVGVAYAIVAWLLIQIADILLPTFQAPDWVMRVFTLIVILGFPIAVFLAWAFELTPEGIKPTSSVEPAKSITHVTGQKLNYSIIALLSLAVVFLVVDNYVLTEDRSLESEVRSETPVAESERQVIADVSQDKKKAVLSNSIAVLPFENLSPDPDNAYFAAGIHDTILNELAQIGDMNVISRTAMLRYANSARTLAEIAEELNVETVMEGSVQYAEGRVLVTAQLIDPKTNAHLWSQNYDREFAGIFALQAEIASNIAKALEAKLLPSELARIEKPMTASPEAYALYLQAVTSVLDLGPFGFGIGTDLHHYLDQAIALDPDFARAYALKAVDYASALIRSSRLSDPLKRTDLERLAVENAQRALAIDPDMGLAYDVLAQVHWFNWQATDAEENFRKAFALSPNEYDVRVDYAIFLSDIRRLADAIRIADPLVETNPGVGHFVLGFVSSYAGDLDRAISMLREAATRIPGNRYITIELAIREAVTGNDTEALRQLRIVERLWQDEAVEPWALGEAAYIYSRIGSPRDAERLVTRLNDMRSEYQIGPVTWVVAYLALGDQEQALQWLHTAVERGTHTESFGPTVYIMLNTYRDPVLEQPEFVAARRQLGPK